MPSIYKIILYPFSLLYALVTEVRNLLFDLGWIRSTRFDVPIISVGNISVGGTGKTPHTEYIVELLLQNNYRVAVLSRGYKRKTKGFVLATENSSPSEIGDEPRQMKTRFPEAIVAVDADRCNGIKRLLQMPLAPQVVVLDDAFQHRYVQASLNILIDNSMKPMSKDCVFPAGRLRERQKNRKRADLIIVSKCDPNLDQKQRTTIMQQLLSTQKQEVFFTSYSYQNLQSIDSTHPSLDKDNLKEKHLFLLTGIASPQAIYDYLKTYTPTVHLFAFPDHHSFSQKDYLKILKAWQKIATSHKILVTTSKDAARIQADVFFPQELKKHGYILPLKLSFLEQEEHFQQTILNHVRSNQTKCTVH